MKYPGIIAFIGLFTFTAAAAHADLEKGHRPALEKMQQQLALTPDQSSKLKALRASEKEAMRPLMEKQRRLTQALEGQVKSKAADADIQATLNDLKANREAMRTQGEQFRGQKEAILTPTQQAQMLLARMKHMRDGRHSMEGGAAKED